MWRVVKNNKVLGNYKHITHAQYFLHEHRKLGGDGFIIKVN